MSIRQDDPRLAAYQRKVAVHAAGGLQAPGALALPSSPPAAQPSPVRPAPAPERTAFAPPSMWTAAHVLVDYDPKRDALCVRRRPEFAWCPNCGVDTWVETRDAQGYRVVQRCPVCGPLSDRIDAFNAARFPLLEGEHRPSGWALSPGDLAAWLKTKPATTEADWRQPTLQGEIDWSRVRLVQGGNFAERLTRWIESPRRGSLLLLGPTGLGKTTFATRAARQLALRDGVKVRWAAWKPTLDAIRATYNSRSGTAEEILGPLLSAELLVIDEIGAAGTIAQMRGDGSTSNADAVGHLERIVSERTAAGRPMVLTTNLLPGQLDETLSARVADRIRGACSVVALQGTSYRGTKAPS